MSPENVRFLLVVIVGPGLTALAYVAGDALGLRLLKLPGKVMGALCKGFAYLLAALAPVAYIPLLLLAAGVVVTVPGAWAVVLALGLGRFIIKH